MTRLAFLKRLPFIGAAWLKPSKPEFIYSGLMPAVNDKVNFEQAGIQFMFALTNNIFIKMPDNTLHTNMYGEYVKVIGTATKGKKVMRIESPVLDYKKDFPFSEQVTKLACYAIENFDKHAVNFHGTLPVKPVVVT